MPPEGVTYAAPSEGMISPLPFEAVTSVVSEPVTSMSSEAVTSVASETVTSVPPEGLTYAAPSEGIISPLPLEAVTSVVSEAVTSMSSEAVTSVASETVTSVPPEGVTCAAPSEGMISPLPLEAVTSVAMTNCALTETVTYQSPSTATTLRMPLEAGTCLTSPQAVKDTKLPVVLQCVKIEALPEPVREEPCTLCSAVRNSAMEISELLKTDAAVTALPLREPSDVTARSSPSETDVSVAAIEQDTPCTVSSDPVDNSRVKLELPNSELAVLTTVPCTMPSDFSESLSIKSEMSQTEVVSGVNGQHDADGGKSSVTETVRESCSQPVTERSEPRCVVVTGNERSGSRPDVEAAEPEAVQLDRVMPLLENSEFAVIAIISRSSLTSMSSVLTAVHDTVTCMSRSLATVTSTTVISDSSSVNSTVTSASSTVTHDSRSSLSGIVTPILSIVTSPCNILTPPSTAVTPNSVSLTSLSSIVTSVPSTVTSPCNILTPLCSTVTPNSTSLTSLSSNVTSVPSIVTSPSNILTPVSITVTSVHNPAIPVTSSLCGSVSNALASSFTAVNDAVKSEPGVLSVTSSPASVTSVFSTVTSSPSTMTYMSSSVSSGVNAATPLSCNVTSVSSILSPVPQGVTCSPNTVTNVCRSVVSNTEAYVSLTTLTNDVFSSDYVAATPPSVIVSAPTDHRATVCHKSVDEVRSSSLRTSVHHVVSCSPPLKAAFDDRGRATSMDDSMSEDELQIVLCDDSFTVPESPAAGSRRVSLPTDTHHTVLDDVLLTPVHSDCSLPVAGNTNGSVRDPVCVEKDAVPDLSVNKCSVTLPCDLPASNVTAGATSASDLLTISTADSSSDDLMPCIEDIVTEMSLFRPLSPIGSCQRCGLCDSGSAGAITRATRKRTIAKRKMSEHSDTDVVKPAKISAPNHHVWLSTSQLFVRPLDIVVGRFTFYH